jgi:hypothetical protein
MDQRTTKGSLTSSPTWLYVNKCGGRSRRAKGTRPRSIFRTYIWRFRKP